jgi:hypothetical protein
LVGQKFSSNLLLELCIGILFLIGGRYDTDYIEVFFKLTQESRQNHLDVDIIQLFFGDSELPSGLNEINSIVDLSRQYCSEFARGWTGTFDVILSSPPNVVSLASEIHQ